MFHDDGDVIGPGSPLWRWAGDWRIGLTGLSTGLLQLMHPGLGAGVAEHSAFFSEPWERIYRSVPQIWATIFARQPEARARAIRDLHRDIKGVDSQGRRYHALDPEVFWWAHATFTKGILDVADRWDARGVSPHERELLYAGTVAWYRRYGVSCRPVPPTVEAFDARFRQICTDVLELTPAAERALEMAQHDRVDRLPPLPAVTWPVMGRAITPVARVTALGGLPGVVRRRFGIAWSRADRLQYQALLVAVRESSRFAPYRWQWRGMVTIIRRMSPPAAPAA